MKKKYNFYIKTRLKGIWMLLTKKYVVTMGSNNEGDISCYFNMTYPSFELMVKVISPRYKQADDKMENLDLAKKADELLNNTEN